MLTARLTQNRHLEMSTEFNLGNAKWRHSSLTQVKKNQEKKYQRILQYSGRIRNGAYFHCTVWESEEALTECVQSDWNPKWMCIVMCTAISSTQCLKPMEQPSQSGSGSEWQSLPVVQVGVSMNNWPQWAKTRKCSFFLLGVYSLRLLPCRDLLETSLLIPLCCT